MASFSLALLWERCGTGVNLDSNKNEHQEYFAKGKGGCYVGVTVMKFVSLNLLEPLGTV